MDLTTYYIMMYIIYACKFYVCLFFIVPFVCRKIELPFLYHSIVDFFKLLYMTK